MSLITSSSLWTGMYKFGGEHRVYLTMLESINCGLSSCISVVSGVAPATVAGFAHFAAGIRELHGFVD